MLKIKKKSNNSVITTTCLSLEFFVFLFQLFLNLQPLHEHEIPGGYRQPPQQQPDEVHEQGQRVDNRNEHSARVEILLFHWKMSPVERQVLVQRFRSVYSKAERDKVKRLEVDVLPRDVGDQGAVKVQG